MPGRDGTGPSGLGAMTGRGVGACNGSVAGRNSSGFGAGYGRGSGLGLGYGCRRGRFFNITPSEPMEKEILLAERNILEERLSTLNKHLDKKKESEE